MTRVSFRMCWRLGIAGIAKLLVNLTAVSNLK
jgi:hypothetical protein